jgi:hypothetical protein
MLEFGCEGLGLLEFDALVENSDTTSMRRQLGRRIGIEENVIESRGRGMNQTPFEANLGHAAWLCLQDQDEIANRNLLFHRQGEGQVAEHLKDTIPYFLGAVPADAASKKASLRDAQRALRRAEAALEAAEQEATSIDETLEGLLSEAHAAGLIEQRELTDRSQILAELHRARRQPPGRNSELTDDTSAPDRSEVQDRRRALRAQRDEVSARLDAVMDNRSLLLDRRDSERGFAGAVEIHAGRLASLDLLVPNDGTETVNTSQGDHANTGERADRPRADSSTCPVCGHGLEDVDATVDDINERLTELRNELTAIRSAPESGARALTRIEEEASRLRGQLAALDGALDALVAGDQAARIEGREGGSRSYVRGRIDATLLLLTAANDASLTRLRNGVATASSRVDRLQAEMDPDNEREQLMSRLNIIGQTMTSLARDLGLEHVENGVRLDLANLTVVTDSNAGPLPLTRIGSAANWIGYHLVTHLAIHRFLVENERPVPRFLMIDQPTQAYYPSVDAKNAGRIADSDHEAVVAMFKIMHDVVAELAPRFQIIVSDHVNLVDELWFQQSIQHYWRNGVRLIPSEWIAEL